MCKENNAKTLLGRAVDLLAVMSNAANFTPEFLATKATAAYNLVCDIQNSGVLLDDEDDDDGDDLDDFYYEDTWIEDDDLDDDDYDDDDDDYDDDDDDLDD